MREVSVPALLIAGAQDKVGRPDGMRELTAVIPGARFVCIEGAGHYSFAEQPGAFNAALLSFLDGLPQRAAA